MPPVFGLHIHSVNYAQQKQQHHRHETLSTLVCLLAPFARLLQVLSPAFQAVQPFPAPPVLSVRTFLFCIL